MKLNLGLGLGFHLLLLAKLATHRGDRYGSNHNNNDDGPDSHSYYAPRHSRGPSRFSDAPMNHHHSRRSPNTFRGPPHRPFESSPRRSPAGVGFRPVGGGGGGFSSNYQGPPPPLSGQKRGFPFSGRGGSPGTFQCLQIIMLFFFLADLTSSLNWVSSLESHCLIVFSERFDRGSFAKLFVGSVPRTATEEDVSHLKMFIKKKSLYVFVIILHFLGVF